MRFILFIVSFIVVAPQVLANSEVVNIYSFREAKLIAPLIDKFSASTGIKVNVVSGKAGKLMKRLIKDGENSFADVILTTNVARLEKAKQLGLLQPANSEFLSKAVPAELRDPEGYWFGISLRARAIFYAKDRVDPKTINTYADLIDAKWKGRVCSRKGGHIYNRAMIASFIDRFGEEWTQNWVNKLVENLAMRPTGGDRDQLRNIKKGACDIALANSYYFGMMSQSSKQQDRQVYNSVGVIWPDQSQFGSHVNISGAAITNAAKNKVNAQTFIEYLLMEEAQAIYSEINHEYPVRADIEVGDLLNSWGTFKADTKAIRNLNQYLSVADKIIAKSGW